MGEILNFCQAYLMPDGTKEVKTCSADNNQENKRKESQITKTGKQRWR
jgi:hypothetical protein